MPGNAESRENLSFLSQYSPQEIGDWLVNGFRTNNFEGLEISWHVDYWETELTNLFKGSTAQEKQLFARGIGWELEHWDFRPTHNRALLRFRTVLTKDPRYSTGRKGI